MVKGTLSPLYLVTLDAVVGLGPGLLDLGSNPCSVMSLHSYAQCIYAQEYIIPIERNRGYL